MERLRCRAAVVMRGSSWTCRSTRGCMETSSTHLFVHPSFFDPSISRWYLIFVEKQINRHCVMQTHVFRWILSCREINVEGRDPFRIRYGDPTKDLVLVDETSTVHPTYPSRRNPINVRKIFVSAGTNCFHAARVLSALLRPTWSRQLSLRHPVNTWRLYLPCRPSIKYVMLPGRGFKKVTSLWRGGVKITCDTFTSF